jgi:hypothetical protein
VTARQTLIFGRQETKIAAWSYDLLENPEAAKVFTKFSELYSVRFQNSLPFVPILNQVNPVYATLPYFCKIYFKIILSLYV